jgi:nucleoside-diphosphate-sugar epimerase
MTAASSDASESRIAELSGHRILITGASGFLGSHLRARLVGLGAEVHGVSRRPASGAPDESVRWWQGDFAEIESARGVLRSVEPQLVFHLSGLVTANPDRDLVLPTLTSLLVSTVNTLLAAEEAGCRRVVLAGSLNEPRSDLAAPFPSSPYAAAKWAAGAYARMFHQLYRTPLVTAKTFMTYGPMQDPRKLVPHVITSLLRGESPALSSGEWEADWIYVDDVIDGLIAIAGAEGVEGESFDIGTGSTISSRNVVEKIVEMTDAGVAPSFGALSDRPPAPVQAADVERTRSVLGWRPRVDLDEGLRRTITWYREARVT